jgi:hypothetical protein
MTQKTVVGPDGSVITRDMTSAEQAQYDADQQASAAEATAANNEQSRLASFVADPSQTDLRQRLRTATPAQIDSWLGTNVTTLAQARTVLGAIIKVIVAERLF